MATHTTYWQEDGLAKGVGMIETAMALWRSVRKEDFPEGTVIEGQPASCVLYPGFYTRLLPNGSFRDADVDLFRDACGVE